MESCRADAEMNVQNTSSVQPYWVQRAETFVMGVEVRSADPSADQPADYSNLNSHAITAAIPRLWQRFFAEQLWLEIPESINSEQFYGVYTDYSSDLQADPAVIVAVEVSSIDNPPEGMVGVALPAGEYLVFRASGEPPEAVLQTWRYIWSYFASSCPYQRAFTTDFTLYNQQTDIYIAVKPTHL